MHSSECGISFQPLHSKKQKSFICIYQLINLKSECSFLEFKRPKCLFLIKFLIYIYIYIKGWYKRKFISIIVMMHPENDPLPWNQQFYTSWSRLHDDFNHQKHVTQLQNIVLGFSRSKSQQLKTTEITISAVIFALLTFDDSFSLLPFKQKCKFF